MISGERYVFPSQPTDSSARAGEGGNEQLTDWPEQYFQGFKDPAVPKKFEKLPHAY